jgi:ribonuclease HI
MNELYCDGGVIGHNPSPKGGTWAFRILTDGVVVCEKSGVITPQEAQMPEITNNLTEMMALVNGLEALLSDWVGTVLSDSQVTLGRAFLGWKWKNVPLWLHHRYQVARTRLVNWDSLQWTLLQGHPTKAELTAGVGSRGYPVSIHNQWCDKACGQAAEEFLKRVAV